MEEAVAGGDTDSDAIDPERVGVWDKVDTASVVPSHQANFTMMGDGGKQCYYSFFLTACRELATDGPVFAAVSGCWDGQILVVLSLLNKEDGRPFCAARERAPRLR